MNEIEERRQITVVPIHVFSASNLVQFFIFACSFLQIFALNYEKLVQSDGTSCQLRKGASFW